jgi:hypothetical protein
MEARILIIILSILLAKEYDFAYMGTNKCMEQI